MAAGSTYTPIATTTASGSVATYTFSSIPSTYTDLYIVISGTLASGGNDVIMYFNGDTGNNYSATYLNGNGTAAASGRYSSRLNIPLSYGSGISPTQGSFFTNIMNYSNTTTYKTALTRVNNTQYGLDYGVGLWRSTAAINSITIGSSSGNMTNTTTLTLYGIAAA
jgi:hypothetical protein